MGTAGSSGAVDRRGFLTGLGAGGLAAVAGALPAGAAGRGRARVPGPPVPRRLQQAIRGHVYQRGEPGFLDAAHVYNERFDSVLPRLVARAADGEDVRDAVRWAVAHDLPLRARSGGHSYAGYSTVSDGVVIDLRNLAWVHVNRRAGTATIGAGAQLIDVYRGLAAQGFTLPGGSCPSVGIAGVTLGGGMGLAGRAFGLSADNLLAADIVTADGRHRHIDRRTDPGLLWALRGGGGGNFGVVTQFTFRVRPLPRNAAYFFVSWPWSSAGEAIAAWLGWAPHARDQLTSILHLNAGAGSTSVEVTGQYLGPSGDLGGLLGPLAAVPGAGISTGDQDYLSLQMRWAGCLHTGVSACHTVGTRPGGTLQRMSFDAKSDYVRRPFSDAARTTLINAIQQRAGQPGSGAILFDSYGGAINRVAPGATAFVHRDLLCCMQYLSYNGGSTWLAQTHASMRPYVSGGAYQNYIDHGLRGWQSAYYGTNYARLKAIRRRVDPEHRFNFPQAIGR
jgi:FAD/FMN-containing dehydrogenase